MPLPDDRRLRRASILAAAATAALLPLLASPFAAPALRAWIVTLGVIGLGVVLAPTLTALPIQTLDRTRWPWRKRPVPERFRQLEEIEYAADFALGTAFDVHFRLRPHLVRIATHRLARRGVSIELAPEEARGLLGEEAWELVRPGRPPPDDRHGSGVRLDRLRRVVEALDALESADAV